MQYRRVLVYERGGERWVYVSIDMKLIFLDGRKQTKKKSSERLRTFVNRTLCSNKAQWPGNLSSSDADLDISMVD